MYLNPSKIFDKYGTGVRSVNLVLDTPTPGRGTLSNKSEGLPNSWNEIS